MGIRMEITDWNHTLNKKETNMYKCKRIRNKHFDREQTKGTDSELSASEFSGLKIAEMGDFPPVNVALNQRMSDETAPVNMRKCLRWIIRSKHNREGKQS